MKFFPGQIYECQTEDVTEGNESRFHLLNVGWNGMVTFDDGGDLTAPFSIPLNRLEAMIDGGYWTRIDR